jgi:hypothetical protein
MDHVFGWYKQKSQIVAVMVAAVLTISANADTVQIARKLFLTAQQKADLGELTDWSAEFKIFISSKPSLPTRRRPRLSRPETTTPSLARICCY